MRRPAGQDGVTTVEFALVFPLFIGIVAMGAFFGWLSYTQAQVDRAAQRAARFAAVPLVTGAYDYCHGAILTRVNADLQSSTVLPAQLAVSDGGGPLDPAAACSMPRGQVRVTITHTFSNPFSSIVALLTPASGTFTVAGNGQARVEG